jgi:tetratricopeptide (TPR) repeat protein
MKKILFVGFLLLSLMVCFTSPAWASGWIDFNACLTAVSRENYDEAIRLCTNAIASGELSREDLSLAYEVLGVAWYQKKDYDKAIADYSKAIEINPKSDEAYYNRGNAWYDKGDYTKAIADYTKVIEINPKDAQAYHCRGDAWGKKGNHAKAKADHDKAKELGYK